MESAISLSRSGFTTKSTGRPCSASAISFPCGPMTTVIRVTPAASMFSQQYRITGLSPRGRSCFGRPILFEEPAARRTADTRSAILSPELDNLRHDAYCDLLGGHRVYRKSDRDDDPADGVL